MALDRDRVTLSVTSPEQGTAAEEVPGDYANEALEIGFNARYLLGILGQIEGDTVEVHLADAAAPTLLRANDKAPAPYVLMPVGGGCYAGCGGAGAVQKKTRHINGASAPRATPAKKQQRRQAG